jgi:hypothetical protein
LLSQRIGVWKCQDESVARRSDGPQLISNALCAYG